MIVDYPFCRIRGWLWGEVRVRWFRLCRWWLVLLERWRGQTLWGPRHLRRKNRSNVREDWVERSSSLFMSVTSINQSVNQSFSLSICLSIFLFIYLYTYITIYLSTYLAIWRDPAKRTFLFSFFVIRPQTRYTGNVSTLSTVTLKTNLPILSFQFLPVALNLYYHPPLTLILGLG